MIYVNRNARIAASCKNRANGVMMRPAIGPPLEAKPMTETVTPAPAPTPTVGQTIDADVAALKAKVAALEAAATTDWSKVKAYIAANHVGIATLGVAGALLLDKLGFVKL